MYSFIFEGGLFSNKSRMLLWWNVPQHHLPSRRTSPASFTTKLRIKIKPINYHLIPRSEIFLYVQMQCDFYDSLCLMMFCHIHNSGTNFLSVWIQRDTCNYFAASMF